MTESAARERLPWQKADVGHLGKKYLQFLIYCSINFHKHFMDPSLHALGDESTSPSLSWLHKCF